MTTMRKIVEHEPDWQPTMLRYNREGDTKPGFECARMMENGNGKCQANVFEIEQAIGNCACCVVTVIKKDRARWRKKK